MAEDEFTKLFKYMQEFRKEVNEKFEKTATKESVEVLTNIVDAYAKKADDYFQEMVMLSHKVDRMERWIQEIAEKTGVKLTYS